MEQSQRFKYKLEVYEKALKGFNISLNIDVLGFSEEVIDTIKNGRIQKFEYCAELTWKVIKNFLYEYHGIDAKSPRESLKEFFLVGAVEESNYELLINILDDRNRLSHIYKEEFFDEIHRKLKSYLTIMTLVLKIIKESPAL